MFTGIVTAVGTVKEAKPSRGGRRLLVDSGKLPLDDVTVGDSIAVSGVCLTVVAKRAHGFEADVSGETLACTSGLDKGRRVNLEKPLRLSDRLGGESARLGGTGAQVFEGRKVHRAVRHSAGYPCGGGRTWRG